MFVRGRGNEDDMDAIFSTPITLAVTKWRNLKNMKWSEKLHQSTLDHEIMWAEMS
jgi:hypothetical protein